MYILGWLDLNYIFQKSWNFPNITNMVLNECKCHIDFVKIGNPILQAIASILPHTSVQRFPYIHTSPHSCQINSPASKFSSPYSINSWPQNLESDNHVWLTFIFNCDSDEIHVKNEIIEIATRFQKKLEFNWVCIYSKFQLLSFSTRSLQRIQPICSWIIFATFDKITKADTSLAFT